MTWCRRVRDAAVFGLLSGGGFAACTAAHAPQASLTAGAIYQVRRDARLAGHFTTERTWTGTRPLPDLGAPGVTARGHAQPLRWLALDADAAVTTDSVFAREAFAAVRYRAVEAWGGRRRIEYGTGAAGGLVWSGSVPVQGGGLALPEPIDLALFGETTAELFLGRADSSGFVARPWQLGMQLRIRPHARLDLGLRRVAVFGGIGSAGIRAQDVLVVFVAANLHGARADDQVASIDARWRVPLHGLPLELYGEWAMHDVDFEVLIDVPAFTVGARLPLWTPHDLSVLLEHTRIARSCCGNPPWYQHFELANGWTEQGVPYGHPLAGHGREWRLSTAGTPGRALVARADLFRRTRGVENLYAPEREGRSHGVMLDLAATLRPTVTLRLDAAREWGAGWAESRGQAALLWHF